MLTTNIIEKIMAEIAECSKRRSGLILSQLEMAFPEGPGRSLVRSAVLNALGNRGLLVEVRGILTAHQSQITDIEVGHE